MEAEFKWFALVLFAGIFGLSAMGVTDKLATNKYDVQMACIKKTGNKFCKDEPHDH